jgi:hypothetical protein
MDADDLDGSFKYNSLILLEGIVLLALRPVFDIQNDTCAILPENWDPFNRQRAAIEPLVRGIGRLQFTGHPSNALVSTGFVCGANAILNNRHVAQIFVQGAIFIPSRAPCPSKTTHARYKAQDQYISAIPKVTLLTLVNLGALKPSL